MRPRHLATVLLLVGLGLGIACSGNTSSDGERLAGPDDTAPPSSAAPDGRGSSSNLPGRSVAPGAVTSGPLGFDTDVYDVPLEDHDPSQGLPQIADAAAFVDLGVAEGVWSEAEGVRAVISVLMGELPATRIPALDRLTSRDHWSLLDRAVELMESDRISDAEREDLVRLTRFFFEEIPASVPEAGLPTGFAFASMQATLDCNVNLSSLWNVDSNVHECFNVHRNDVGDVVLGPADIDEVDPVVQVLAAIEEAREGYETLALTTLPRVAVAVIPRPQVDADGKEVDGHTLANHHGACRIAIFASSTFFEASLDFAHTLAHELFHCIQGEWDGPAYHASDLLTREGGANYFAWRLIEACPPGEVARGASLDVHTISQSLLNTSYEGWFFWAFLDEHGFASPQVIAQMHQAVKIGTDQENVIKDVLKDPAKTLNEFYVRMIGPGLACGFRGRHTSGVVRVDSEGPVELWADFWVGTRYRVKYSEERRFELSDPGGGPMGMAKVAERRTEAGWVTMTEEVRSRCNEPDDWVVVVTSQDDTAEQRKIDVDDVEFGVCDACLIGRWSVDLDTLDEFYEASPQVPDIELDGSWEVQFSEGSEGASSAQMTDQRNIVISFEGTSTPPRTSEAMGAYAADDTRLTINDHTETVETQALGFSSVFTGQSGGVSLEYACEDDTLTVQHPQGAAFTATREPPIPDGDPYF